MRTSVPNLVRGAGLLGFDGFAALTRVVESMHADIAHLQMPWHPARSPRTRGVTGFVYRSIDAVGGAFRWGFDRALAPFAQAGESSDDATRAAFVAALNGVVGDHLEATRNPLAQPMSVRHRGRELALEPGAIRDAVLDPRGRVAILIHGLCMNDLQWTREGASHGDALERRGFTVVHLLYNTGRHVSTNGRELAGVLDRLAAAWPVPLDEIGILAHSMGGLVARSACHYGAGSAWLKKVRRAVFLGTPHHGASLERGGNLVERIAAGIPFAAALARVGMARSAGITDLRFGNLVDEDWLAVDRFARREDRRAIVGLPAGVECFAVAGVARAGRGDGLVEVGSALGEHADPRRDLDVPAHRKRVFDETNHFDLLHSSPLHEWVAERMVA